MPWALGDLQAWPILGCPVPLQPGTGPCVLAQSLDTELKQQDDAMDGTWPSGNATEFGKMWSFAGAAAQ